MDGGFPAFWSIAAVATHLAGAVVATGVATVLVARRGRFGAAGSAIVAGLYLTAGWSLVVAAAPEPGLSASVAETLRNLAWLLVTYRLFAGDGRHTNLAPIRPVVVVLTLVELLHLGFGTMLERAVLDRPAAELAFEFSALFRLLFTIGALVLVHNLYAGASSRSRAALRWPATALAALWAFDLNLYAIAYLDGSWPTEFVAARGLAVVAMAALFATGASKARAELRIRPSRTVTFQTFSLLVIGAYLVAMVTIAQWLAFAGGDFARLMGLGFLTAASAVALFVLPSKRLRGWARVMISKHLFQHRYDYRSEWLRFTRTIGNAGDDSAPLGVRVVKAVADIAESPAGLLLAPGDHGELVLAARWHWPEIEVPGQAWPVRSRTFFEREEFIVELDAIRTGRAEGNVDAHLPDWLLDHPRAWALVPLIHFERLVGLIVLARPPFPRKFDWEDFDLLRVVGRQLASYLAENASQDALAEANRFDDFNRRIAFVMHDIKNLASQLSLLARNAELHAEKPAFRADMLVTLRSASDKLNTLLARLSRYGGGTVDRLESIHAADLVRAVVSRFDGGPSVIVTECQDCIVAANRDSLEQVLAHLVQNAIDASCSGSPVFLSLTSDTLGARFEIVDSGCGMSPDFVRTKLFRPFVSTKQGGFGIGAFEARELVRAMRGRLEVESREGLGSRFIVRLPLAAAAGMFETFAAREHKVAS